jgi:hypothetical protein
MATATGTMLNSGDAVACPSLQAVAVTLVGSGLSGAVAFEALAADGSTWLPVLMTRQDTAAQATTAALAGSVAQVWSGNTFGTQSFRVRATTALGAPLSVWLAPSASFFRPSGGGASAAPADNGLCQGRLTLTSGVPVTTADVTAAAAVYWTPFRGNRVALWNGSAWVVDAFAETALPLGTLTAGLPYDVFAYDVAGVPALEQLAWTNATTRATAVTFQDGVACKAGDKTRRYLGTFYTTSTTTTEDSALNRNLANYYNRVGRRLLVNPGYNDNGVADNYSTTSTAWTPANGGTGATGSYVSALGEDAASFHVTVSAKNVNSAQFSLGGIGHDSVTTSLVEAIIFGSNLATAGAGAVLVPAAGRHTVTLLVYTTANTATYYADDTRAGGTADPRLTLIDGVVQG